MKRIDLKTRTFAYLRDPQSNLYREQNVYMFIDEAIDRCKEYVDELAGMKYLRLNTDVPEFLPESYHYILALYSAARNFELEERFYQGTQKMNEFEVKLDELRTRIRNGDVVITNKDGVVVSPVYDCDEYVNLGAYWNVRKPPSEEVIM